MSQPLVGLGREAKGENRPRLFVMDEGYPLAPGVSTHGVAGCGTCFKVRASVTAVGNTACAACQAGFSTRGSTRGNTSGTHAPHGKGALPAVLTRYEAKGVFFLQQTG